MFDSASPLPNPFTIPGTSCSEGSGHYELHYETETSWSGGLDLSEAWLECSDGDETIDLVGEAAELTDDQKEKIKEETNALIRDLGDIDAEVPTNTDELQSIANDAGHPITATILGALIPLVAEVSGVGVYGMVTTILRTVIYSPSAWMYLPAIVYVLFMQGQNLVGAELQSAHSDIEELDTEFQEGNLAQEEYEQKRQDVIAQHVSA